MAENLLEQGACFCNRIPQSFQKIKEEETLPSSFHESSKTLILKPVRNTIKKCENYSQISSMNIDKILKK